MSDPARTIGARAEELAPLIGVDAGRLLDWCVAFAAMTAAQLAERDAPLRHIEALVSLAQNPADS